jgi:hypothetical protein
MAGILTYEVDKIKRKELTNFWGVKKPEEFISKGIHPEKFFMALYSLEAQPRVLIGEILKFMSESGDMIIEKNRMTFIEKLKGVSPDVLVETGAIDRLDTLHLVERRRDRANLSADADRLHLTPAFKAFLEQSLYFKDAGILEGAAVGELTESERSFHKKVFESYYYQEQIDPPLVLSLLKKGRLAAGFSIEFQPVFFALDAGADHNDEAASFDPYALTEAPAFFLFALDLVLYGKNFNRKVEFPKILQKVFWRWDETWALALSAKISSSRKYRIASPRKKVLQLLELCSPWTKRLALRIALGFPKPEILSESVLRRKIRAIGKVKRFPPEHFSHALEELSQLGLILLKKERYQVGGTFIRSLFATKKKSRRGVPEDRLMIDTDFAITAYRQVLTPAALYELLLLAEIGHGDHLYTAKLSRERAGLYFWTGRTPEHAIKFFKRYAPTSAGEMYLTHLKEIFGETEMLAKCFIRSFQTPSRKFYLRLLHELKEAGLSVMGEEHEGKNLLIIRDKASWKKTQLLLKQRRWTLIS